MVDHRKSKDDLTTKVNDEEDVDEVEPSPEKHKLDSNVKSKDDAKDWKEMGKNYVIVFGYHVL